jgi:riboflavin kinase/FMN adenylyltransferase
LGERLGVRVVHVAPLRIDSTTASSSELRRLISGGLTEKAADMLGRRYSVGGTVAHGRKLGRTIGFPTANLSPDPCKLLPATGVYAATASVDGIGTFPAMVNIGHRPTVDRTSDAPLSIEAHLIGADADMYDRRMVISFVRRLRDERTFASVDELASQLAADRENAIRTLTKK